MEKVQEGIVLELLADGMAKVKTSRHNDCDNCGACPGNSAMVLTARNPLGAKPGQLVAIEVKEVNMLKAAFIVYMQPLLAAFGGAVGGWLIAERLGMDVLMLQILGGVLGFALAIGYVKYFDISSKTNLSMQPVIRDILSNR